MSDDYGGGGGGGDYGAGADSVTEVTTTGWLSRILGSIVGALIGIVMVIGSLVLLWWNEGRAVDAYRALAQGERQVVEIKADAPDPSADGKLVHVTGPMATQSPARDGTLGVGGGNLLRLKRTAEMFQWIEHKSTHSHKNLGGSETTETTYSYEKEWAERGIDSGHFHSIDGHRNPPMNVTSATFDSSDARLGSYRVDRGLLQAISAFTAFDVPSETVPNGYRKSGDVLYRGQDSNAPSIGDVRLRYTAVPAQTMSAVAAQTSGTLAPYHAANGYTIALADTGVIPATTMLREKAHEESIWTWVWRCVGYLLMLFGFALMANPVSVFLSVIPFIGELAGIGAFLMALIVATPLTLFVIALAWIIHRPLVGIGLIAAGGVLAYLLRRLYRPAPPVTHFLPVSR